MTTKFTSFHLFKQFLVNCLCNKLSARSLVLLIISLGLKSVVAYGAPASPDPTELNSQESTEGPRPKETDKVESTAISPAPTYVESGEPADVHPYFNHISPRLGSFVEFRQYSQDKIIGYSLGFTYGFQRQRQRQWEFGANLISRVLNGRLMVRQKRYLDQSAVKAYRPFYTLGGGVFTRAEDNLFFFTKLNNYTALGSIGFESLLADRMSWTIEFELGIGIENQTAQLIFGYLWAW